TRWDGSGFDPILRPRPGSCNEFPAATMGQPKPSATRGCTRSRAFSGRSRSRLAVSPLLHLNLHRLQDLVRAVILDEGDHAQALEAERPGRVQERADVRLVLVEILDELAAQLAEVDRGLVRRVGVGQRHASDAAGGGADDVVM